MLTVEKRRANWTEVGLVVSKRHEYNMVEFLKRHMSIIRRLTEFGKCIEIMKKDEVVNEHLDKLVGAFTSASMLQTPAVIEGFLTYLMSELQKLDLNESSFLKVYQVMENFFHRNSVEVEVFAHLEGLKSEVENMDIGGGWAISKISQTQLDNLLTDGLLDEGPNMSRHALYWRIIVPKIVLKDNEEMDSPSEFQEYQSTVRQIVTALRLFKSGDVGFRRIIRRFTGWLSHNRSISTSYMRPFWGTPYSLEYSERDGLRKLLHTVQKAPPNPAFELALKRLNDAVERQHPYDMMIDYMIAFEALFLFKDDKKKPILPKRVAVIIQNDDLERDLIIKDMESAYNLRNSIAHGDTESETYDILKKIGYSKREFAEIIGDYLRRAIRGYLSYLVKGKTKNEIVQELGVRYSSSLAREMEE